MRIEQLSLSWATYWMMDYSSSTRSSIMSDRLPDYVQTVVVKGNFISLMNSIGDLIRLRPNWWRRFERNGEDSFTAQSVGFRPTETESHCLCQVATRCSRDSFWQQSLPHRPTEDSIGKTPRSLRNSGTKSLQLPFLIDIIIHVRA